MSDSSLTNTLCARELYDWICENPNAAGVEIEWLQAKIDALMLEYCPDEMTPEQRAEWAKHQRPSAEPSEGYSQEYADQMRTALLRISLPVYLNLKPAYTDPDNVKAICDGLNERIKIAQDALLGLGKREPERAVSSLHG